MSDKRSSLLQRIKEAIAIWTLGRMLDALAVGSQLGDVMHVDENLLELASHSTRYFADRTAATWHMHQQTTQRNRMPRAPASRHVFVHTAPRVACNFEIGLLGRNSCRNLWSTVSDSLQPQRSNTSSHSMHAPRFYEPRQPSLINECHLSTTSDDRCRSTAAIWFHLFGRINMGACEKHDKWCE